MSYVPIYLNFDEMFASCFSRSGHSNTEVMYYEPPGTYLELVLFAFRRFLTRKMRTKQNLARYRIYHYCIPNVINTDYTEYGSCMNMVSGI